jgi:4-amino-4-deoxy-L-arabinose transferase-like glycosyltransferase
MLLHPAVVVFALIGLPWYVLCYWHNGFPFIDEFFIRHNFQRLYSAEAIGHPQPFWFYLPILPAALFPWAPMILVPLRETWRHGWKRVTATPQQVLLIYWIALPFVFFSLSENKLPGYLLPVLPPLTLWIAHTLNAQSGDQSSGSRFARLSLGLSGLLLLAAPLITLLLPEALATGLTRAARQLSLPGLAAYLAEGPIPVYGWISLAALVLLSLALLWRGNLLGGAFAGLFGVAWVVLLLTTYLAPAVNSVASMRTIAQRVAFHNVAPGELAVFYLHRNQIYGLGFYLRSLPPEWRPEAAGAPIRLVAARSDIAVDELHPGARSLTLFPRQNLRLWSLPLDPASELATAGASGK